MAHAEVVHGAHLLPQFLCLAQDEWRRKRHNGREGTPLAFQQPALLVIFVPQKVIGKRLVRLLYFAVPGFGIAVALVGIGVIAQRKPPEVFFNFSQRGLRWQF